MDLPGLRNRRGGELCFGETWIASCRILAMMPGGGLAKELIPGDEYPALFLPKLPDVPGRPRNDAEGQRYQCYAIPIPDIPEAQRRGSRRRVSRRLVVRTLFYEAVALADSFGIAANT